MGEASTKKTQTSTSSNDSNNNMNHSNKHLAPVMVDSSKQQDAAHLEDHSIGSSSNGWSLYRNNGMLTAFLILVLGSATAAFLLGIGIKGAIEQQQDQFERAAVETTTLLEQAFEDYVNAVGMVHSRCRRRDCSRQNFRDLYEFLVQDKLQTDGDGSSSVSAGLAFKAVQYYPNTSHAERPAREADTRAFYNQHYPHINYTGFVGFNNLDASGGLQPRQEEPWYFPVHYMEPVAGNEAAIDLDYHSSEVRIRAVEAVFDNQAPSLSDRLSLVKKQGQVSRCGNHNGPSYGVVLAHPGQDLSRTDDPNAKFSNLNDYDSIYAANTDIDADVPYDPAFPDRGFKDDVWPRDLAAMVLCIPDLLTRSTLHQDKSSIVYIHDNNHPWAEEPVFMGGATVVGNGPNTQPDISFLDETDWSDLDSIQEWKRQANIHAANRVWTITVVALPGDYDPVIMTIVLGSAIIFVCSVMVSVWVVLNGRRMEQWNAMTAAAQAEKAALILQNAQQQAKTERELNDFLAHEVRNPVAAAMAACNFVTVEVNKEAPLRDNESRDQAREDLKIIDNALHFVNDLLRNMLDMHRVASKQLVVTMVATDLLHDVMEPVAGMLHRRGSKIKLVMECPPDLLVLTDPLRLKQVILNLGRNSSKFIDVGFIRLQAVIVGGLVRIHVDDSGCGVPEDKQQSLFNKFQESLDVLSQGTGIGLFLCKTLTELMGGSIYLDPTYHSGVQGHPGTRFVVDLKQAPIEQPLVMDARVTAMLNSSHMGNSSKRDSDGTSQSQSVYTDYALPEQLSVLFVDDDPILRKLFSRTIRTVLPNWTIREAANGETALRLAEEGDHFDLIFVDMYMASVEKQLLGTETVAELRNRGIKSRICGLSANDKESLFYEAGADAFMFKPFPCKKDEITEALCHVLYDDHKAGQEGLTIFDS